MKIEESALEQIRSTLLSLREGSNRRRAFPREVWESIIELTKTHSVEEVCRQLRIHPPYLRCKMREFAHPNLEFREISLEDSPADFISIELRTGSGLKAKIEGPLSSLKCLHQVFGGQQCCK